MGAFYLFFTGRALLAQAQPVTLPRMRLGWWVISLVVLGACSDAAPCSSCPPIDGVYAVSWADAVASGDGGSCSQRGPRVPTWTFAERGAQVTATIAGVNLGGTLYDTYDLVLSGAEGTLNYRLRALTIPEGPSTDAGVKLQGTFTTRTVPDTGEPCSVDETFTAQRTSR